MSTFEITLQRKVGGEWPAVSLFTRSEDRAGFAWELPRRSEGCLQLDLADLLRRATPKEYGAALGKALFRDDLRDALAHAQAQARQDGQPLRVLLQVEADELKSLHWERLCAPLDGSWDFLCLNQQTPFSLYLPSLTGRRYPPIGRRDLKALALIAGPQELDGDYGLAPFDVPATLDSLRRSLGAIPHDFLAAEDGVAGPPVLGPPVIGPPTLEALSECLTAGSYSLLHLVCHGRVNAQGETVLYLPDERRRPVPASTLIERLARLQGPYGLPHFAFLMTCESASPQAENGFGGLGQRLVRELGMPAVLAMTAPISIRTAGELAGGFYTRLNEHGEVDRALAEALAPLMGRHDVTVPAVFSRLGGRPLFSDALDRPLTPAEIQFGLEKLGALVSERAPVLAGEYESLRRTPHAPAAEAGALSDAARQEQSAALQTANDLSDEIADLSFQALALGRPLPPYDGRCPFRGLAPFRPEDRVFFFGREALVKRLLERLEAHPFLAVLGSSGSGKSSLVLAGLVPALEQRLGCAGKEAYAYLTPGDNPPARLEAALQAAPEGALQTSSEGALDGAPACALVVVDQFEELFTLCRDEAKRAAFIQRLLDLRRSHRVVLTMRADFWGECAPYPVLKDEMQAHQELVAPLDAPGLRRAIEQQAAAVGLRFEADLAEDILDDVGARPGSQVLGEPGAMPLLQHALLLLWDRRRGRWLRSAEYRSFGGVPGAIAHTADGIYLKLASEEQKRVRDIFLRLTRLDEQPASGSERRDTRRRVALDELVPAGSERVQTVELVRRLADARLVVTGLNPVSGQEEVEVAHEALIRHWKRLQGWLEQDRTALRRGEQVREAARQWQESGRRDEGLLVHRGGRLDDALELAESQEYAFNQLELDYLHACRALRQREQRARQRGRNLLLAAAVIAAIVFAFLAWRADRQARQARSGELAALSLSKAGEQLDLALLLGVEAYQTVDTNQARTALFEAWQQSPYIERYLQSNTKNVASLAWSPDGRLASGSNDGKVMIWDLERDDPALILEGGHSGWVAALAWSPDDRLASGSHDGTIIVWDLERGTPAHTLAGHTGTISSLAWSPDGRLASGSHDRTIILWDLEREAPAQTLDGIPDWVMSLAWSPEGRLASGLQNGAVLVWDLERGIPAQTLEGHTSTINSVAWSPDGRLASGGWDLKVIVWDLEAGAPAQTLAGPREVVINIAWVSPGTLATVSSGHTLTLWFVEEGAPALTLAGSPDTVDIAAWSPDGRLASGTRGGAILLWDLGRRFIGQTLWGHQASVYSLDWAPDGRLATGASDGQVIVWDAERSEPAQVLSSHHDVVALVAWSPDGQLVSASWDETLIIWDLARGVPAQVLTGHQDWVAALAWSPDGRLATGGRDGTIILWDLERGVPAQTLTGAADSVVSLAWSPDGRLASNGRSNDVIVWDLRRGAPAQFLAGHTAPVTSVAWSSADRLASGDQDGKVIVWDLRRGAPAQTLSGHNDWIYALDWSGDSRLASSSADARIRLWDLERGMSLQSQAEGLAMTMNIAWSPDGRLAFASTDTSIQIWQLDPQVWIDQACQRAGRNLTRDEWAQYFPGEQYHKICDQWP